MSNSSINTDDAILGCLLGGAVGDSLGLPTEGLSRQSVLRTHLTGLHQRLLFKHGMISDDTEHTLMLANSLCKHSNNIEKFQRSLAWKLRWWLLALPAGVGFTTAKAILRLWLGFSAHCSGVRSAGNGAAMRTAIIGAVFSKDTVKRQDFALAACQITHTSERAEESVLLVTEATALAVQKASTEIILNTLRPLIRSNDMRSHFTALEIGLSRQVSVKKYAKEIGCQEFVSGYAPNTVAIALFAWLRHRGDFSTILAKVIACGGDTDSIAAIAGGICGAEVGESGIPKLWLNRICDWPRSVSYIRHIAQRLTQEINNNNINTDTDTDIIINKKYIHNILYTAIFCIATLLRNVLFLGVILFHGFARVRYLFMPKQ